MTVDEVPRRTVLITAASRHGSTQEIAERIYRQLAFRLPPSAWALHLVDIDDVESLEDYDAAVVGSAIYFGRWLKRAERLIDEASEPPELGLWLFSSGPVEIDSPATSAAEVEPDVRERLDLKDSIVFAGRINGETLGIGEHALTRAMRVADGDFRSWDAIDAWADSIASDLTRSSPDRGSSHPHGTSIRNLTA